MAKLSQIVDDIILSARNGQIAHADKLSENQVALWVIQYRAKLIKERIDKDRGEINQRYTQVLQDVPVQPVYYAGDNTDLQSEKTILETVTELPQLMVLNNRPSILSVWDSYGNAIQIGNRASSSYQKYRKYTCGDYMAYLQDNHLRIEGPGLLDVVNIRIVAEDPTDPNACYDENAEFPLPDDQLPLLKNLIFTLELGVRNYAPSDIINNSMDDTLNKNNPSLRGIGRQTKYVADNSPYVS